MTRRWRSVFWIVSLYAIIFQTAATKGFKSDRRRLSLKAFLGPIPKTLDPTTVTSFTEYVIIQQMTRGLVKLDGQGQTAGDIAESWKISQDASQYTFTLRTKQFFSNGDEIDANSLVGSFQRQMNKGKTIHYDFAGIKSVVAKSPQILEVTLQKPDAQFISKLTYPEFSVLHKSDFSKNTADACEWRITSGATTLKKLKKEKILLSQEQQTKREIEITGTLLNKNGEVDREIDFFVGVPPLSADLHEKISKDYESYSPRLSFTYFFSIGKGSYLANNKPERLTVFNKLYKFRARMEFVSPFHFASQQLYLEDGPGRTPKATLTKIQSSHEKDSSARPSQRKIKILLQKSFPYYDQLIHFLQSENIEHDITFYPNFDEFDRLTNSNIFDLIQTNNDFSASDLTSNIMVTLNPKRPLVETFGNKEIDKIKLKIETEFSDQERISSIQRIEEILLQDALVFPIFHLKMYFYVNRRNDSSELSRRFPEVSIWKLN